MLGIAEQLIGGSFFDDLSGVHHSNPIGHLGNRPDRGNQDDRGVVLFLQIAHPSNLRLNRRRARWLAVAISRSGLLASAGRSSRFHAA
jgi:hypothetical protein